MVVCGGSQVGIQPHYMEALVLGNCHHSNSPTPGTKDPTFGVSTSGKVESANLRSTSDTLAVGKDLTSLSQEVSLNFTEDASLAITANDLVNGSKPSKDSLLDEARGSGCTCSSVQDGFLSDKGSPRKSSALKDRRRHSWLMSRSRRNIKRSQALSLFQSRNEAAISPHLAKNAEDDEFHFLTEKKLRSQILLQALSICLVALVMVFSVFLCILLMAVPFVDLERSAALEFQAGIHGKSADEKPIPCWIYAWVNQVIGFFAGCGCLVGCSWLADHSPWNRLAGCHCCEDSLRRTRSRADEAEQRAYKAHVAKQQFIAYVFHNIRVPFNAIVLGLGLLRVIVDKGASTVDSREKVDLVQMMLDCAETITSVLDDVTDMGRPEEGATELNVEEFDLLAVVKLLSRGLKDLLYQKQVCFSMHVDPVTKEVLTTNHVVGDKCRILQTLGNFLRNAVKFTPAGGRLELTIQCQDFSHFDAFCPCSQGSAKDFRQLQQNCSLCRSHAQWSWEQEKIVNVLISVKDTGIGIPVEDQEKIFEPFSFVTSSWVQKAGVSGLGLSMAKCFAEKSGGYIGVQSREGEGSTFYVSVPYPLVPVKHPMEYPLPSKECSSTRVQVQQDQFQNQDASTAIENREPMILQEEDIRVSNPLLPLKDSIARRVLLVEDTEVNRIILRKVLQNLNLHCEEAENGQVAVDFLKQGRTYDLILMDKEMPVMDGPEATRQLRLMGVRTPIVALTGNALQSDKELFFEAGVDDFQTKPLSRDKLVQLLAQFGVESSCEDQRGV